MNLLVIKIVYLCRVFVEAMTKEEAEAKINPEKE